MNINDYRKKIFLNSQYCTYYNTVNNTVLAGIIRNIGYMYSVKLPDEKLREVNQVYRKFTTIMNCLMAVEIILYIYLVIFPYFTEFMSLPLWAVVLLLSFIPLIALYLTYIAVNYFYEKYLIKYIGTFKKTAFKPDISNIDEKMFNEYEKIPRKSKYVLIILAIIFLCYVITPFIITGLNNSQKYASVEKLSNIYLTFVPINPNIYAQRAYANFKQGHYEQAIQDYEKANKYSLSENFSNDIIGVKTYYLSYDEMIAEFDKAIEAETDDAEKYFLQSEKAAYRLIKSKDYKLAYNELSYLIDAYVKGKKVFFSPSQVYYNRGVAREALGDINGANSDKNIAKTMCPDCNFVIETMLIRKL